MWFIYILLCSDGSLYTGSTNDVAKRFLDHLKGKGAKYTKSHAPVKILYTEKFSSKSTACKREREIQSWTRKQKIEQLHLKV